jgi:hypothetical protein
VFLILFLSMFLIEWSKGFLSPWSSKSESVFLFLSQSPSESQFAQEFQFAKRLLFG